MNTCELRRFQTRQVKISMTMKVALCFYVRHIHDVRFRCCPTWLHGTEVDETQVELFHEDAFGIMLFDSRHLLPISQSVS